MARSVWKSRLNNKLLLLTRAFCFTILVTAIYEPSKLELALLLFKIWMNPYFFLKMKQSRIFISVPIYCFMTQTFISNPNLQFFLKKRNSSNPSFLFKIKIVLNLRFFFKKETVPILCFRPEPSFLFKKETFRSFVSDPNLRFFF